MKHLEHARIVGGHGTEHAAEAWAVGGISPAVLTALAGAGVGIGLCLIVLGARTRRPKLATLLAVADPTNHRPAEHLDSGWDGYSGWVLRLGLPAARAMLRRGLPTANIAADLRVAERPPVVHLATTTVLGLAGLVIPALIAVPLAVAGAGALPLWVCVGMAVLGFLAPDVQVRQVARRRRVEFRRAIGTVVDLTAIALAGGAGVEQALTDAAAIGTGWAHDKIRTALDAAAVTRSDPWAVLGRLGVDLGVDELSELAATLLLAGTEGARVRASLTTKAASLRAHHQTDDEAAAGAATERMSLPIIVLFAAYLVFIGYPALTHVLNSL
ncbi:type II secretion system F family protein [Pseudonocardia sp. TRM90224]|uniref:type II secretion system F family protein n=1 Tax=Pseudonocardia sp. TRM90224 TaxID=2812678 RepID=UPI001E591F24|nr:type II secretion system F family protein [Pseudonocardia sp. TRM90224]